jgi:hypothetical protein
MSSFSLGRVGRFIRANAAYLMLAPLLALVGTIVHEAAHAAAGVVLGAKVESVRVWPRLVDHGILWGSVRLDRDVEPSWLVDLAPAIVWTALAASALAWLPRVHRRVFARTSYMFAFLLPLADVSMSLAGLFTGDANSDDYKALHGHELAVAFAALVYFGAFLALGWRVFRVSYGDALSRTEYVAIAVVVLVAPWTLSITRALAQT